MLDPAQLRIEAAHKKVVEVFSKNYAFTIPPYQRPYAWETTQVEELLTDLNDAMEQDKAGGFYFLGSIVLVKAHGSPEARVVDGQQRLTTLTILFSVIRDLTEDYEKKAQRERYIKQVANEDEGIPEALRLRLRQQDQAFFEKHIQRRGATDELPSLGGLTDAKARIVENARLIRDRLQAIGEEGRTDLLRFLLQSCYLVVVEVPSDTAARRIFTVLNARGLDLAATDILKADLLERAGGAKESALSQRWEQLETALGRDLFNSLFMHLRMIYEREKPRVALESGFAAVVPEFRENPDRFIDAVLEPFADALMLSMDETRLRKRFDTRTADLVRSLERLDNRDWLPVLLLCLRKHNAGHVIDVPDIVFQLERLAYFLFLTRADVNTRIARYADVLDDLEPLSVTRGRPNIRPRSGGLAIQSSEASQLFDALNGKVYLVSKVVKPLMLRLEQASIDGSVSFDYPVISVEHVCPQTVKANSQWAEWFPDEIERAEWTHRLANLVLLSSRKNSEAQNFDFEKKKTKYFAAGDSSAFTLTNEARSYQQWTIKELEERQKELLGRLAKSWRLEQDFATWQSAK